jgi:hypothetical protein
MILAIERFILNRIYKLKVLEQKLQRHSGYKKNSIIAWKKQSKLSWRTVVKILNELQVYTELEIRAAFRSIVEKNHDLFHAPNTFIIPFGETGKSGDKMLYEFRKAVPHLASKIIEKYEIVEKFNANLIFLDDIIGTGYQSTSYIFSSINQLLNTSNTSYLITIYSTPQGVFAVQETGFRVLQHELLDETKHFYLSEICNVFTAEEKAFLDDLIYKLIDKSNRYHLGLLVAFHYSTPDNTMPIIWKNQNERDKMHWSALLPKDF